MLDQEIRAHRRELLAAGCMERRTGRVTGDIETRTDAQGMIVFEGYASTTNHTYDMGWYTEDTKTGAWTRTLAQPNLDVVMVFNHGDSGHGFPAARTTNGTLDLAEDGTGFRYAGRANPKTDPDAVIAAEKVKEGLLNQCSYAFRVVEQQWTEGVEQDHRSILAVNMHRGDVSVVNMGANENTPVTVSMRSMFHQLTALGPDLEAELRATFAPIELRAAHDAIGRLLDRDASHEEIIEAVEEIAEEKANDLELYVARARALRLRSSAA